MAGGRLIPYGKRAPEHSLLSCAICAERTLIFQFTLQLGVPVCWGTGKLDKPVPLKNVATAAKLLPEKLPTVSNKVQNGPRYFLFDSFTEWPGRVYCFHKAPCWFCG